MIDRGALYDLLAPLIDCPLIWAEQDGPRPPKPYAAMKITSERGAEHDLFLPPDEQGRQTVYAARDANVEFQCFGAGTVMSPQAMAILGVFRQRLDFETSRDAAYLAGVAVFDRNTVTDLSAIMDKMAWEDRAMVEIGIRSTLVGTDTPGLIKTVVANGTLTRTAGNALATTVNVESP